MEATEPVTISHKIAIDARMWRDHGIGSYLKNLVVHVPAGAGGEGLKVEITCSAKLSRNCVLL